MRKPLFVLVISAGAVGFASAADMYQLKVPTEIVKKIAASDYDPALSPARARELLRWNAEARARQLLRRNAEASE